MIALWSAVRSQNAKRYGVGRRGRYHKPVSPFDHCRLCGRPLWEDPYRGLLCCCERCRERTEQQNHDGMSKVKCLCYNTCLTCPSALCPFALFAARRELPRVSFLMREFLSHVHSGLHKPKQSFHTVHHHPRLMKCGDRWPLLVATSLLNYHFHLLHSLYLYSGLFYCYYIVRPSPSQQEEICQALSY